MNLGVWANSQADGGNVHDEAVAYATEMHRQLFSSLGTYPGRVVFGGVAPGFDDYTQNWGACTPREIPRDPAFLQGQMDYLSSKNAAGANVRGVIVETWDDWTEGTETTAGTGAGASAHAAVAVALAAALARRRARRAPGRSVTVAAGKRECSREEATGARKCAVPYDEP